MRRYLLYTETEKGERRTGAIVDIPGSYTSDDYARLQEEFEKTHGGAFTNMISLHSHDRTSNGVYYDWGLAGPGGAWFTLIGLPDISRSELTAAAHELRRSRDVVRLNKLRIHKLATFTLTGEVA